MQFENNIENNIRNLRLNLNLTQAEFSKILHVSQAAVSRWENGDASPSYDTILSMLGLFDKDIVVKALFDIDQDTNEQSFGSGKTEVRWTVNISPRLPEKVKTDCQAGIEFFIYILVDGLQRDEALKKIDRNLQQAYDAFYLALKTDSLRITYVSRDKELEERLIEWSNQNLRDVFVASLPRFHDCTIIRTEYVSWLAARFAMPYVKSNSYVGLGAGYTIRRMAEISVSGVDQYIGTTWVPLITYKEEFEKFAERASTANYNASYLMVKHPGSKAISFPFADRNSGDRTYLQAKIHHLDLNTAFCSVNGFGRGGTDEPIDKSIQFLGANLSDYGVLRSIYLNLPTDVLTEDIGGEFLGFILDKNGKKLTSLDRLNDFIDTIDMELLQAMVKRSDLLNKNHRVFLVGARKYKAKAIYATLKSSMANALVIDSEIANQLLEMPPLTS